MPAIPATITEKTGAALQGDINAFGALFQWYNPRLYAHALRICGNTPSAQDAVQETFISAFLNKAALRDPSLFYPWLKKILFNHCFRLLKKEKRVEDIDQHIEKRDQFIHYSIEESFEKKANQQWVYTALNELSEEIRACLMLRYFSSYKSYEDIATIMGIPIGTVRSRLAAAREKLLSVHKKYSDTADGALNESRKWSGYYQYLWDNLYENGLVRNELLEHMLPQLRVRYTSGKSGQGRELIRGAINDDLEHGTQLFTESVISSGEVSVIEGPNLNSPEFPDHCPPSTVIVLFRDKERIQACHIFDSARSSGK